MNAMLGRSIKSVVILAGLGAFVDDYQTSDVNGQMDSARERRRIALEKFILSLSDQQLVTGLAILIAGYINRCSMSFYHFRIVAALAWFTSTTHLATLTLLRTYLINHPRVRDWRVAAMLGILALLALAQVLSYSTQDNSVPFQCALDSLLPGGYGAFEIPSLVAVVFFLGTAYTTKIIRLYSLDPDWSVESWLVVSFADAVTRRLEGEKLLNNIEWIMVASSRKSKAEQGAVHRKLQERRRYDRLIRWLRRRGASQLLTLRKIAILQSEVQESFLSELLSLLFSFTYGVTSVVLSRINTPNSGVSAGQDTISFGQLVPLFLIALPILTAGEVYSERENKVDDIFPAKEGGYTILFDVTELVHGQLDDSVTRRVLQREILRRTHSELLSSSLEAGQSGSNIPLTQMHSRPSRRVARNASMRVENDDIESGSSSIRANRTTITADNGAMFRVSEHDEVPVPLARSQAQAKGSDIWGYFFLLLSGTAALNVAFAIIVAGVGGGIGGTIGFVLLASYIGVGIERVLLRVIDSRAHAQR
ncbi:hypothetical protein N7G274_004538 [Stereocaulon virgatum]|uniref:Uncharacterized protein n=1 Tax=Stereocaulon virgatum TaxID=373712 RepID=A0ABR4AA70_9LECA